MKFTAAIGSMLAGLTLAQLEAVTITTAPPVTVTALVSRFSDWNHHTLGINMTVGGVISSVYAVSAANPTAAEAILGVRSHLNYMEGPTPLLRDLENPSSVLSSIAAQVPTDEPYPAALLVVSDIYAYLGSLASSALDGQTTIPPAPAGWTWAADTGKAEATSSAISSVAAATSATAAATGSQTERNGAASLQGMAMWAFALFFGAVVIAL